GVVLATASDTFHYSPLKVAEYLAAGVPVVAPLLAPLAQRLEPDGNAVFYPAGDTGALSAVLEKLRVAPERRRSLRDGALASSAGWSWDEQIHRVRAAAAALR